MFEQVQGILVEPVPPALRAALFEVTARIPGIVVVGDVTDRLGRSGTALAVDDETGKFRIEVTFDPTTSAVLARRQIQLTTVDWNDLRPGDAVFDQVVVSTGVVSSTDARP